MCACSEVVVEEARCSVGSIQKDNIFVCGSTFIPPESELSTTVHPQLSEHLRTNEIILYTTFVRLHLLPQMAMASMRATTHLNCNFAPSWRQYIVHPS